MARQKVKSKRRVRITTEQGRLGTKRVGHGWAAKQAAKRKNRRKGISLRTIKKRLKRKGQVLSGSNS